MKLFVLSPKLSGLGRYSVKISQPSFFTPGGTLEQRGKFKGRLRPSSDFITVKKECRKSDQLGIGFVVVSWVYSVPAFEVSDILVNIFPTLPIFSWTFISEEKWNLQIFPHAGNSIQNVPTPGTAPS